MLPSPPTPVFLSSTFLKGRAHALPLDPPIGPTRRSLSSRALFAPRCPLQTQGAALARSERADLPRARPQTRGEHRLLPQSSLHNVDNCRSSVRGSHRRGTDHLLGRRLETTQSDAEGPLNFAPSVPDLTSCEQCTAAESVVDLCAGPWRVQMYVEIVL